MSTDVPSPPISADVDVRSFPYTPIYRARMFASSFNAHVSDAGWRAGVSTDDLARWLPRCATALVLMRCQIPRNNSQARRRAQDRIPLFNHQPARKG